MSPQFTPYSLPESWSWTKFGDVVTFITDYQANGSFASLKENVQYFDTENHAVLVRLKDLRHNFKKTNDFVYTDQHGYNFLKKSALHGGEILVANVGANVGTTLMMTFINRPATLAPNMFIVYPSEALEKKFFLYFAQSGLYWREVERVSSGTGQPKINKKQYRDIFFPVAPLNEQLRIVGKIETLFTQLDAGVEALRQAKAQLKRYRQSVLKAAFSGTLTEEWRVAHRITASDSLLELILEERKAILGSKYKAPRSIQAAPLSIDGWKWVRMEDIAEVGTGATPLRSKKEYYENGNYYWVTSGSVNQPYIVDSEEKITDLALKETNTKIFPVHTLIVAMYGEGKTRGKVSELLIEAATNQACAAITFNETALKLKSFVKLFLQNNYYELRRAASGGVQPNLNLGIIKEILLPIPSEEEANQIVLEVERIFSIVDRTEDEIDKKLIEAKKLRQSILKQAFSGKLVPQEPSDEPASNLLERIRAEKAAMAGTSKTNKKSRKTKATDAVANDRADIDSLEKLLKLDLVDRETV